MTFVKGFISIVLVFTCVLAKAQVNFILNPSFEEYTHCPDEWDQIKYATHWNSIDTSWSPGDSIIYQPYCVPDFCHTCATQNNVKLPNNSSFSQYPRTGNGLAQVIMFSDETKFLQLKRDYLQGHLSHNLEAGKSYCVTFYVNLTEESQYATNHIGAYFDNGSIDAADSCSQPQTQCIPQIVEQNIINDELNWVKIEGSFIANGNEKFVTIGNFYDKANTSWVQVSPDSNGFNTYLIDDVSVIESDLPAFAGDDRPIVAGDSTFIGRQPEIGLECVWHTLAGDSVGVGGGLWVKPVQTTTYVVTQTLCGVIRNDTVTVYVWGVEVKNIPYDKGFTISPNPVKDKLSIKSALYKNGQKVDLSIYDMSGRSVLEQELEFSNGNAEINTSFTSGVYIVELKDGSKPRFLKQMIVE